MSQIQRFFSDTVYTVVYRISEDQQGERLDHFLKGHFTSLSREWIKAKIARGEITIKERQGRLKPSTKIQVDDQVVITTYRHDCEDEYWNEQRIDLEVPKTLYEDDDIIVISKPAFMSAHPTGRHLFNTATVYLGNKTGKNIRSVHRLDRETSGVLITAKNAHACNQIRAEFEEGRARKAYFLISKPSRPFSKAFPLIAQERLSVDGKGSHRILIEAYPSDSQLGRWAETKFELLYQIDQYALLLAFPKTGRQHQIRIHAATHGFPLLGDKIYNGGVELFGRFKDRVDTQDDRDWMEIPRQALHSTGLCVNYRNSTRVFTAPIPEDLKFWIQSKLPQINIQELDQQINAKIMHYFDANKD